MHARHMAFVAGYYRLKMPRGEVGSHEPQGVARLRGLLKVCCLILFQSCGHALLLVSQG